jgi:osmotically-inducible protein OsmY
MTRTASGWDIRQAVVQELEWDTRLRDTEVNVEANGGIVTLSGTVDSYAKKLAAQEAAHRVKGVVDVVNDIHILMPGHRERSDREIAEAVRRALEWDVLMPHEKIKTAVESGTVTLEGTVPSWTDREQAVRLIRNLTGVRGITNNLVVSAGHTPAGEIRQSIEAALQRRATREADNISIEIKEGVVSLSGRVHNWNEKQAVLGAASHAPGVQKVEDHLQINPIF